MKVRDSWQIHRNEVLDFNSRRRRMGDQSKGFDSPAHGLPQFGSIDWVDGVSGFKNMTIYPLNQVYHHCTISRLHLSGQFIQVFLASRGDCIGKAATKEVINERRRYPRTPGFSAVPVLPPTK